MNRLILSLSLLLILLACNKPDPPQIEPEPSDPYERYIEPITNPVYKEDLFNGFINPPTYHQKGTFQYWFPCFNPQDPYQIAFLRGTSACANEVMIFDFRTGRTRKVTDNACYGLDWSSKGWLIYTGINRKVWKVKASGGEPVQLTFGEGFHNYPKWSPDGEKFAYANERDIRLSNSLGKVLHRAIHWFVPLGWLNNEESLVGQSPLGGLAGYHWDSTNLKPVYQGYSFPAISYFDAQQLQVFMTPFNSNYFFVYDINRNTRDTIRRMYETYSYGSGDYHPQTQRAIIQLNRKDWKDSLANEIYIDRSLMLLDGDGNELGVVQLLD
ncbi:MAG: hypothetical protein AAFQ83_07710 [Bacteroidota bacterium]